MVYTYVWAMRSEFVARFWRMMGIAALILPALAGCGAGIRDAAGDLPLAADQPTVLFFFTDN